MSAAQQHIVHMRACVSSLYGKLLIFLAGVRYEDCCGGRTRRAGPAWLIPGHTMGIWPASPLPQWGSPAEGPTRYRLTVTTNKRLGAGTNKPALVQLHGSRGSTGTSKGLHSSISVRSIDLG